jgi:hypothetical protein
LKYGYETATVLPFHLKRPFVIGMIPSRHTVRASLLLFALEGIFLCDKLVYNHKLLGKSSLMRTVTILSLALTI